MSDIDYEELFRSPLDDPAAETGWAVGVGGLMAGILTAVLISAVLGGGGETESASDSPPALIPSTSSPGPAAIATEFPPGFLEYVPGLGIRPSELLLGDETITLAFTTAVARGGDPLDPIWPIGGTWWLETADGTGVESSRVILGRFSPGVFAVEFPATPFPADAGFSRATMIEKWNQRQVAGSATVPFDGEPYALTEPLVIPVTQEISLLLERLELGRFLGRVDWAVEGPEDPVARVLITATLLDSEGERIGTYEGFPVLLDPAHSGVTEITWREPFPTSQEGAVTVEIGYAVGLMDTVPSDVSLDLSEVSIGR